ncbi:hypothetical protein HY612_03385 [Candidatus Roizmanbacteria bacterium]|nr:hypothetical protein [Candidatus Roizmanbacteria bacterium]
MKHQNRQLDDIFHIVSRFTIIVPIIVVLFAIFLKFSSGGTRQKSFIDYKLTITPIRSKKPLDGLNTSKKSSSSARFNLIGPLNCFFSTDTATISANIKDKKIYLRIDEKKEVQNYLLRDDCVYIWRKGNYSGEKICGISQQIGMIEGLLSSNFLDPSFIFGSLDQVLALSSIGKSQDALKSVLNSCKKEEIQSLVQFDIPKNVLFRNKSLK